MLGKPFDAFETRQQVLEADFLPAFFGGNSGVR